MKSTRTKYREYSWEYAEPITIHKAGFSLTLSPSIGYSFNSSNIDQIIKNIVNIKSCFLNSNPYSTSTDTPPLPGYYLENYSLVETTFHKGKVYLTYEIKCSLEPDPWRVRIKWC